MSNDFRLTATMASRKLQALRYIRDYFEQWERSPSLGEIGAALGISRQRARALRQQLVADGSIGYTPGTRGITLPELHIAAVRHLRAHGWIVNEDTRRIQAPRGSPFTNLALPPLPTLDHMPGGEAGIMDDGDQRG